MDSYTREEVTRMSKSDTTPANAEQLKLLIALHHQLGVPFDPNEIAGLSKWQASERINILRGRPSSSSRQLDNDLAEVLRLRAAQLGEAQAPAEPTPARGRGRARA
jgi:hypothetical protein